MGLQDATLPKCHGLNHNTPGVDACMCDPVVIAYATCPTDYHIRESDKGVHCKTWDTVSASVQVTLQQQLMPGPLSSTGLEASALK